MPQASHRRRHSIASRAGMRIGGPKETAEGERRVALVPEAVRKLANPPGEGVSAPEVLVERGAGAEALIPDAQYEEAGAQLVAGAGDAAVVVKVTPPSAEETGRLKSDSVLIGFLQPLTNAESVRALAQ